MNLLLLSKEKLDLAKAEAEALLGRVKIENNILVTANEDLSLMKQLAFANKICKILFVTDKKNLERDLQKFDWNSIYKKSFCLRIEGKLSKNEAQLAGFVWNKLKNPKVDLEKPGTRIEIIAGRKIYCCLLLHESDKKYLLRKTHLRPMPHPTSLHPKLAKALVNLSGAVNGEVVDPFCGSGGILMEAGLMGLKAVGYDIDKIMLKMADKNLAYFKVKGYKLVEGDGTKIPKADYVVTDLPYGRSSKLSEKIDTLYLKFLKNLKKVLQKRAVVVFPDNVNYRKLAKGANLKIEKEFSYYIHKSLTKKITVLR
jgi:tRNA (guanine10-N2)-dimethyltransferase